MILPALAALGSLTSVAALNWAARDADKTRRRGRKQPHVVLRDVGRDCRDLQDAFKRLARGLPGIVNGSGTTSLPMKFGVHGLDVTADSYPLFQSLLSSISALVLRSCQDAYELAGAIEDGAIDPPEEWFFAIADQQERLNQLLASPRPSLKATVETGYDVAVRLSGLMEELGAYVRE